MSAIIKKTEEYVRTLMSDEALKAYKYHRFEHTEDVVNECKRLAAESSVNGENLDMLLLAAWFHDTGYIKGSNEHESQSESIARDFLTRNNYDKEKIEKVSQLILETKVPQKPETELGKILCDADMSGLGSESYRKTSKKLRKEKAKLEGKEYEDGEWIKNEIEFLTAHQYFTPAAHKLYDDQKKRNIEELKAKQTEAVEIPQELMAQEDIPKKDKEKKKKLELSRGVETMFRTSSQTHINLSSMADSKANIMLSINALIISVTISVLIPKLDSNTHLIIPAIVLLATCLLTIIFATLSTRPKVTSGKFTREDIEQKRANLVFFGNFYNMDLKDYEWGMEELMKDNDYLYRTLSRDLYFLGKVLAEKYKYLRICYTIFMFGLIASVIAFGVSLALFSTVR